MTTDSFNTHDYVAFISYCHRSPDRDVARKLARAIETYRLPTRVANAKGVATYAKGVATDAKGVATDTKVTVANGLDTTAHTHNTRRLGRVFRDEDELEAASSLPDKIQQALERSEHLIVVCSPETPKSSWVSEEIETFIRFHGSDNIHLVLAEGEPDESFPPALSKATVYGRTDGSGTSALPKEAGTAAVIPSDNTVPIASRFEPVAADMRVGQGKLFAVEKLRIIAALAGCSFDDLRQREKQRVRKRVGGALAAALVLLVAFGGLAWRGNQARQDAFVQESVRLAAESRSQLAQADRYGAIEKALAALPQSSTSNDRPLVPEAQDALEAACQVVPEEGSVWRECYVQDVADEQTDSATDTDAQTDSAASGLPEPTQPVPAFSPTEGWMVPEVGSESFNTHNALTGALLATCTLPEQNQASTWHIIACRDKVVAYAQPQGLACFAAESGEMLWHIPDVSVDTTCVSADGTSLAIAFGERGGAPDESDSGLGEIGGALGESGGALDIAVLDAATGKTIGVHVFEDAGVQSRLRLGFICMGETSGDIYLAAENELYYADMKSGTLQSQQLELPIATALAYDDERLFVASRGAYGTSQKSDLSTTYTIQAFSSSLEPLWEIEGTFEPGLTGGPYQTQVSMGNPQLSFANVGQRCLIASAGASLQALAPADGSQLYNETFSNAITGIGAAYAKDDADILFVVLADGTVEARDPANLVGPLGDSLDLKLGSAIESATVRWTSDSRYLLLARTAGDNGQLVAFRTNFGDDIPKSTSDYTLDELITYAHELLDAQQ